MQYFHREIMLTLLRKQRVLFNLLASSVPLLSEAMKAPKINRHRAAANFASDLTLLRFLEYQIMHANGGSS